MDASERDESYCDPKPLLSPFVFSPLLRLSFVSQMLFERKMRKSSLQEIDRRVIAGLKHQASTVFLRYDGPLHFRPFRMIRLTKV
jgi:hypothetical protein